MFPKNMKNYIPFIVGILIFLVYIKFINSFDLAIKYSIFPLILAFLFYYNLTLAVIATLIFTVIFIYNMKFSKAKQNTSKKNNNGKNGKNINVDNNVDNDYDYINTNSHTHENDVEANDETINDDTDMANINSAATEGMSNKRLNRGVDRIDVEQNIRSKESNTLMISKDFTNKSAGEPVSVGGEGIVSGYVLMNSL